MVEDKTFVDAEALDDFYLCPNQTFVDAEKIIIEKGGRVEQFISCLTDYVVVDPCEDIVSLDIVREKQSQRK